MWTLWYLYHFTESVFLIRDVCQKPGKSGSVRFGVLKKPPWKQFSGLTLSHSDLPARARSPAPWPISSFRATAHMWPREHFSTRRARSHWPGISYTAALAPERAARRSGISPEHTMTRIPAQRRAESLLREFFVLANEKQSSKSQFCPFQGPVDMTPSIEMTFIDFFQLISLLREWAAVHLLKGNTEGCWEEKIMRRNVKRIICCRKSRVEGVWAGLRVSWPFNRAFKWKLFRVNGEQRAWLTSSLTRWRWPRCDLSNRLKSIAECVQSTWEENRKHY